MWAILAPSRDTNPPTPQWFTIRLIPVKATGYVAKMSAYRPQRTVASTTQVMPRGKWRSPKAMRFRYKVVKSHRLNKDRTGCTGPKVTPPI